VKENVKIVLTKDEAVELEDVLGESIETLKNSLRRSDYPSLDDSHRLAVLTDIWNLLSDAMV